MFKMIFTILFFPIVIAYYGMKFILSFILGILRVIGFIDIASKM
ncbi:MAG: hypothetical protein ACI4DV_01915 [Lachnospiraceae bacterium]